ncbi:hypothetical protein ACM5ME_17950 [Bacillus subtilis]|uniref:hypothetical protein n=1 Tax=Bacillus subtilis TaxID=1423 RepID=UPI003AAB21E3
MSQYVLIVTTNNFPPVPSIVTYDVRIDFVKIGQAVVGRNHRGQRINKVINRSSYFSLEDVDDKDIKDWWKHVKAGLAKDAVIYDGYKRM